MALDRLVTCLAIGAATGAVALWTLGTYRTPQPLHLSWLVGGTLMAGALVVLGSGWGGSLLPGRPLLAAFGGVLPPLATALFLGSTFLTSPQPRTSHRVAAPHDSPARMRVVSFNVLHDYPRFDELEARTARLAAALRVLDADVVLLQEAWWTPAHGNLASRLAAELGMDSTYVRANGSRRLIGFEEGLAALSRWPIVDARAHSLAPRRPAVERRIALSLEIRVAPGQTVPFVVTHLTHSDSGARDAQALSLLELVPTDWHLVAGDFNGTTHSAAVRAFAEHGYRTLVPGGIDHVLVPTGGPQPWIVDGAAWTLRPADLERLIGESVPISDHPGIVVDLRRRDAQPGASGGPFAPAGSRSKREGRRAGVKTSPKLSVASSTMRRTASSAESVTISRS